MFNGTKRKMGTLYASSLPNPERNLTGHPFAFSLPETATWLSCRNSFSLLYSKMYDFKEFHFCTRHKSSIEELPKFLTGLEEILNVEKSSLFQLEIQAIANPRLYEKPNFTTHGVSVTLSPFWLEHPIKISFLSGFLKSLDTWPVYWKNYTHNTSERLVNLLDARVLYFHSTKYALTRFLNGHTKVNYPKSNFGWVDVFYKKSSLEVDNILIK